MSWRGARSAHSSGSALARARVAAGLTQAELAAKAQVAKGTISWLESGRSKRPRLGTASPIALALGLTIADLWPTLAKAIKQGRFLDTVIPIEKAVRKSASHSHGLRLVFEQPEGGRRVHHRHRPPLCCGETWCRCVAIDDPATYPIFGDPKLIEFAAGGANA